MLGSGANGSETAPPRWFATTLWTTVLQAREEDSSRAREALGRLCQIYWQPVNAYIRRSGHNPSDADDLTQQFFALFLEKQHYRLVEPGRGKFRSFLLASVKNFLVNQWKRASAQKRGGGETVLSLDECPAGGEGVGIELKDEWTAERAYETSWALSVLARVRARIEAEYEQAGKLDRFLQLEKFLPGEQSEITYAEAASRFGVAEGTIKSDVHRLKKKYREVLREEIASTVTSSTEIDQELRYLVSVLSRSGP